MTVSETIAKEIVFVLGEDVQLGGSKLVPDEEKNVKSFSNFFDEHDSILKACSYKRNPNYIYVRKLSKRMMLY